MGGVQRTVIDGVPVFSAGGRERTTAALVFGVGLRDETFATIEVTHLVEHLAMAALPRTHLRCTAVTDVDPTTFSATGRPEAVGAFLEGVCRALSDLPTERMDLEVGVLQAESCGTSHSTMGALWAARFGLTGPGLVLAAGPGPEYLTEETVRGVFGLECRVIVDPTSGRPLMLPIGRHHTTAPAGAVRAGDRAS